ncbi:MAG: glycosyltransferase [Acetobacteraceae bacterium]
MRVLTWQWGRRGAGPRFAAQLATGFAAVSGVTSLLSLSAGAEILRDPDPPRCALTVRTYDGPGGLVARLLAPSIMMRGLSSELRALAPDLAICAMPGPLDLVALRALHRIGVPVSVIVHDAEAHPGDGYPLVMALQRRLIRRADAVIALSSHVGERLLSRRMLQPRTVLITGRHPPFAFGAVEPPTAHDGPMRLLSFGRLLPYKGLDLLAASLALIEPRRDMELRVVGSGPESEALRALRGHEGVTVENRWVPEAEVGALLAWADAVVLPYREASQSGVAAAALAAGRRVICTRVGGLAEQLAGEPLAVLCEPDAASLAAAVRRVLDGGPSAAPPAVVDPADAWREFAAHLLDQLGKAFPLHPGLRGLCLRGSPCKPPWPSV